MQMEKTLEIKIQIIQQKSETQKALCFNTLSQQEIEHCERQDNRISSPKEYLKILERTATCRLHRNIPSEYNNYKCLFDGRDTTLSLHYTLS